MHQVLFEMVEMVMKMSDKDKELCLTYFQPCRYPKNTLIEQAGTIHRYQNFVISGHLRNFHMDENGEEVTTDINEGPRFFSSYVSMMDRKVSHEYIQSITPCEILRVKRDDIDIMMSESDILKDFTIHILQFYLEDERKKRTEMANLTAEQRYLLFSEHNPQITRHVPLNYIASLLGMKPESLSRIRRKLIS